jgi:hypothetical protein
VTVLHDPTALIPRPPYGSLIVVRLMVLASLARPADAVLSRLVRH